MDKYTKFMLTLIAASLMWISLNLGLAVSTGYAGTADAKIEIADVTVARSRALPVYVTGESGAAGVCDRGVEVQGLMRRTIAPEHA